MNRDVADHEQYRSQNRNKKYKYEKQEIWGVAASLFDLVSKRLKNGDDKSQSVRFLPKEKHFNTSSVSPIDCRTRENTSACQLKTTFDDSRFGLTSDIFLHLNSN